MISILQNIIGRLFLAIGPSILWNFLSLIITYGLYKIKGKDIQDKHIDFFTYICITNYILIFFCLFFFYRENIQLF